MSVKRSGLGKNLSALLGSSHLAAAEAGTAENANHSNRAINIGHLPLEALVPGKYQPRRHMEDEALKELANSIKRQGLLQPILVRKLSNGTHEILAGERRYRASVIAGLKEIPVLFRDVDDETAMALALVENIQREDLNPIDQARAMARLSQEFSLTHQEIAQLLSKSRAAVSNFLRLLTLSQEVLHYVEKGALDMGHARSLLSLDEEQQIEVAEAVVSKQLSVRDTERYVQRLKENLSTNGMKPLIPYPASFQGKLEALSQRLQVKVKLKQLHAEKGVVVIHYDSLKSLDAILSGV